MEEQRPRTGEEEEVNWAETKRVFYAFGKPCTGLHTALEFEIKRNKPSRMALAAASRSCRSRWRFSRSRSFIRSWNEDAVVLLLLLTEGVEALLRREDELLLLLLLL